MYTVVYSILYTLSRHIEGLLQTDDPMCKLQVFRAKLMRRGAQSRQSTRLFLQSSELGLPTPHLQANVSPHFGSGGEHTRLQERGYLGPSSDEGTDTVVL